MSGYEPRSALGQIVNELEETAIAILLGAMTIITFVNVVMRYVFNASLIWGLELTLALFAWLVLFGMSYAVKVTAHLGVDAVINILPQRGRRILALIAAACCLIYAFLLLKGAWDYWAPFAGFEQTGGRWFPDGFIKTRDQAWYETEQIPMPDWLRFIEPIFNQGEHYEKLPRFIPYAMLPFGVALLMFRLIQATWGIVTGTRDGLIVSHEAEDAIEDVRHMNQGD
ncbi:C4-dicarboxylate transporter DctQ subunit [Defluviimonas denitrificans]|jgi:C4-dicarboxylate transporter DctQ subunit|uniref:TRAP transporter small permease protein n=1 Tax=Albidovulum denitrificans TaxID=404881 RepID=A0A2S8S8G9_9RHOB|nr:TRAP transporter small permease [Defluviimonas denitrificans]PQV57059.1 C4-dicarboxylate transporter DctQ subunit [Defluviimonas denitrificans]